MSGGSEKKDYLDRLARISDMAKRDGRYKTEAYLFVIEALHHEINRLGLSPPAKKRHLTARELMEGVRNLGWDRFGRLFVNVLERWGITGSRDFGEIVFNLIDLGEFSKTADDRKEDFEGVFDFGKDLVQAYEFRDAGKN